MIIDPEAELLSKIYALVLSWNEDTAVNVETLAGDTMTAAGAETPNNGGVTHSELYQESDKEGGASWTNLPIHS